MVFCDEKGHQVVPPDRVALGAFIAELSRDMSASAIKSTLSGIRSILEMLDITFEVPASIEKQIKGVEKLQPVT